MKRATLVLWFGIGVSTLFLGLLLRRIDGRQLVDALQRLDWHYLVAAIAVTFVSYWLRAVRWRLLLLHERPIQLRSLYAATIIGYMANNLFPARLGEFVRVWVLSEREQLKVGSVFASLVIDRMLDGLSVMVMLLLVLLNLKLPPGMEQAAVLLRAAGITTLSVYLCVVLFLLLLKARPVQALRVLTLLTQPLPQRFGKRLIPLCGSFLEGLRLTTDRGNLLLVAGCSVLIWVTATLPIDLILKGFGLQLPLTAAFFIMVLLVFAVMVPAAPGSIGVFHVACYTGLVAFRLPDTQAVSIALVVHGVGFFPVILVGCYYLWSGGISLSRLRTQATVQGTGQ